MGATRPESLAERGTRVRSERAALKRAIKEGLVDVGEVLRGNDPLHERVALDMPIRQLVEAIPGIGQERAAELVGTRYWLRAMGGMTVLARQTLADALDREKKEAAK